MDNKLDCDIVVNEFDPQILRSHSLYYIWKRHETHYPSLVRIEHFDLIYFHCLTFLTRIFIILFHFCHKVETVRMFEKKYFQYSTYFLWLLGFFKIKMMSKHAKVLRSIWTHKIYRIKLHFFDNWYNIFFRLY